MLVDGIVKGIVDGFVGQISILGQKYLDKQISKQELDAGIEKARIEAQGRLVDAATKGFAEFQETVRASPVVARAFAAILALAGLAWAWSVLGAPAYQVITGEPWPADQAWAVGSATALIVTCLGGGALLKR